MTSTLPNRYNKSLFRHHILPTDPGEIFGVDMQIEGFCKLGAGGTSAALSAGVITWGAQP
jgi:hypothetical protein